MGIPREQLQAAVDAGHPDNALVAMPVSLVREILGLLPVAPVPVLLGLDLATGRDLCGPGL